MSIEYTPPQDDAPRSSAPPTPLPASPPSSRPPNAPDLRDYKAFGSFAPIYTNAKRKIWECYPTADARHTLFVLDALAQHANHLGTMYRLSYRELIRTSHMRYENVKACLLRLVYELGYLREHRVHIATRNHDMVDWQLNPYEAIWISAPSIDEATALWSAAKVPNVSVWETQPESETEAGNKSSKQTYNQTGTRNSPQGSERVRWQEADISLCQKPLQNPADEAYAQSVARNMNTGITQARQMILSYGQAQVVTKMAEVRNQMSRVQIAKPAALLLTVLRTAYGRKQEIR